jgi:hypothetical protein
MKRSYLTGLLVAGALWPACSARDADVQEVEVTAPFSEAAPVTGHPRIWVTAADLPRLRSWATASNPMYAKGLQPALSAAINTYNTQFFPNGQENLTWPDPGDGNWVFYDTEAYAEFFAFMSLVDADPTARAAHGARARNLLMHAINQAAQGLDTSSNPAPYRGSGFSTYNRANYWGEAWGLTVDWAYPYFSAADKAAIQKVFLRWSNECINASTTAEEHPQPVGVINDPKLLADKMQLRWAANNYYTGHMRNLTMMSLALDAADDPPVDPSSPVTQLGNSMRSYLADVTGAWLYQQYAVYTDAQTAAAALGVPAAGLGVVSGGLAAEGFLYGESIGNLHEALLALHTAGYDDPAVSGPQAALIQSPYWDRFLDGFLHSITASGQQPNNPSFNYLGQIWQMSSYGEVEQFYITPDYITPFASMGIMDQNTGNASRLPALRWIAENVLVGGAAKLYDRASAIWGNSYATQSILYYLLFDPSAPEPADPRPGRPLVFSDPTLHRVLARTDWTPNATAFDYIGNWETINHQVGSCNEFQLWRKGEWLTKERTGYSNDGIFATSDYHNTLAIQNDTPANLQWYEGQTSARGGQWTNGSNAGDPSVLMSSGAGWVYAYGDATNLYNRPDATAANAAMDVTHASRSIVWVEPDHVFVYDRATTKTAGRFKRFNLTLLAPPAISGHTATVTSAAGQRLTIQSLLPASATLTASPVESFNAVADLEPTTHRLVVEDPAGPSDIRFLHVLEAADAGVAVGTATLVESSSGTPFEGAAMAGSLVMFPVTPSATFTGTSWTAPAGVTTQLATGLTPGAGYTVSTQTTSAGIAVTVSPGGSTVADSAGVVVVSGSAQPPPPPPTCTYALSASSASFAAAGGSGSVGVTAPAGCAWTATSNAGWITVTGTSATTASFTVAANTATSARTGTVTVAGQAFTITQAAAATPPPPPPPTCTYALSASSASFAAAGGSGSVDVTAPTGCAWTATSNAAWITVTSTGATTVSFTVAANTATSARTGTVTIAGQTFTVTQAAAVTTCSITLPATSVSFPASGGTKILAIQAPAGCPWVASSGDSWIWEYQPVTGMGNGWVKYYVRPNYGAARSGTITVGGQVFTVHQAGH